MGIMQEKKLLHIIFPITFLVIFLNLIPLIFPLFYILILSSSDFAVGSFKFSAFEMGVYAIPFLIVTPLIFTIGLLFYRQLLPTILQNALNYFINFEISQKKTILLLAIIFSIYFGYTVNELSLDESIQTGVDDTRLQLAIEFWPYQPTLESYIVDFQERYFQNLVFYISTILFGNIKIVAFVSSILLLLLTYFFSKEITNKRFAGVISVLVVVTSYTFLKYDTIGVYSHLWVLLYIFSLFLMYKKWQFSSIAFFLSVFSKATILPYLPASIYFLFKTKTSLRQKFISLIFYGIVISVALIIWQLGSGYLESNIDNNQFDFSKIWSALSAWHNQFRYDFLIIFTILPLSVGLFLKSKKNILAAEPILFLILTGLSVEIILYMISNTFGIFAYRYSPLVIFFALGIGIMFSQKKSIH